MRTEKGIKKYIAEFLEKEYGLELSIPVKLNGRLKRALGRFITIRKNGVRVAHELDFAKDLVNNGTIQQIKDVARHEAIHYAMFKLGRPYEDGQEEFEAELRKHNASSTNTLRVKRKRLVVIHKCDCASNNVWEEPRSLGGRYKCTKCEGVIVEVSRHYEYS